MLLLQYLNKLVHYLIILYQIYKRRYPQIVESYVKGDMERHVGLVLLASRYSLYLISLIAIPF